MLYPKSRLPLRLCTVLAFCVFISACSPIIETQDFTFSAPAGYKTKLYDPPYFNSHTNAELILFSNKGHNPYFVVTRQMISLGSDLNKILAEYVSEISGTAAHYQFISQKTIRLHDRQAIEYVHSEFSGEPYIQSREIWMAYSGYAYSLVCAWAVDSTPGIFHPIPQQCIQLAEGFQFK